jgi:SAM-dependent methyltransferase
MNLQKHKFYSDLRLSVFFSGTSFFRMYQTSFLSDFGKLFTGKVIEVGGELSYAHKKHFPQAEEFVCSNIGRDYDVFIDVTKTGFESNSQDAYICISVLEHVKDITAAVSEMERTLKPGGKMLLTIPFAYPYHDTVDYWRLSIDAYYELFKNFDIIAFVHFGGIFSAIVDNLRRPRGFWKGRYFIYKLLALVMLLVGKFLDRKDYFPLGFGLYAIKK